MKTLKLNIKNLVKKKLDKLSDKDLALEKKLLNYNFEIPKKEIKKDLKVKENLSNKVLIKLTAREIIKFMIINRWTGIDSFIL